MVVFHIFNTGRLNGNTKQRFQSHLATCSVWNLGTPEPTLNITTQNRAFFCCATPWEPPPFIGKLNGSQSAAAKHHQGESSTLWSMCNSQGLYIIGCWTPFNLPALASKSVSDLHAIPLRVCLKKKPERSWLRESISWTSYKFSDQHRSASNKWNRPEMTTWKSLIPEIRVAIRNRPRVLAGRWRWIWWPLFGRGWRGGPDLSE